MLKILTSIIQNHLGIDQTIHRIQDITMHILKETIPLSSLLPLIHIECRPVPDIIQTVEVIL